MDDYYSFIKKVYKDIGVDLSLYKEKQMKRRLTSLRERRGFKSFTDYYEGFKLDQDLKKNFLIELRSMCLISIAITKGGKF